MFWWNHPRAKSPFGFPSKSFSSTLEATNIRACTCGISSCETLKTHGRCMFVRSADSLGAAERVDCKLGGSMASNERRGVSSVRSMYPREGVFVHLYCLYQTIFCFVAVDF